MPLRGRSTLGRYEVIMGQATRSAFPLVIIALALFIGGCDPSKKEYEKFYRSLEIEFKLAAARILEEDTGAVGADFRKRMDAHIAQLEEPATIWDEYRRTLTLLRFTEAVERVCGKDKEERNTNLDDISLAAVSFGFGSPDGCRRLFLFAALYKAILIERVAVLPDEYRMDESIQARIKGASSDPDCLVKAGFLFVMADEKDTLQLARKLLGSADSFHCGCCFLDFLEPGDLRVALKGVETIADADQGAREKKELRDELLEHLEPLIRQEKESVEKNLKLLYKAGGTRGWSALVALSYIEEFWDGEFWLEVAQNSPVPEEKLLALKVSAWKGDEGLAYFARILQTEDRPDGGTILTGDFLKNLMNIFIVSWKNFSGRAIKEANILPLLREAAKGNALFEEKMPHIERLYTWQGESSGEQEAVDAFLDGVNAIKTELETCWLKARLKDSRLHRGVVKVRATVAAEGEVYDVSAESRELESQNLMDCIAGVFFFLSFNPGLYEEDDEVSVNLAFPMDSPVGMEEEEGESAAPRESEDREGEKKRVVPNKPQLGKVVIGGGKGIGISDVRSGLKPQLGHMSICAGAAREKSPHFQPGEFLLKFDVSKKGKLQNIAVEGEAGKDETFLKCLRRTLGKAQLKSPDSGRPWVKIKVAFEKM